MKDFCKTISVVVIGGLVVYLSMTLWALNKQSEKISELTYKNTTLISEKTAIVSAFEVTEQTLKNKMDSLDQALSSKDFKIQRLVEVNARLRLREHRPDTQYVFITPDMDTVLTKQFGDSLFEVQTSLKVTDDLLAADLDLIQLRDLRFSIVEQYNEETGELIVSITSDDLDIKQIKAFKIPKGENEEINWWKISAVSTWAIIVIKGLLNDNN